MVDFILNFLRYLLRLRRYKRNLSKSAFFEGVGHFECKFQTEGGVARQLLLVSENYSDCSFVWYQNIRIALFSFVTKHACAGRTDRITTPKTALA